MATEGLVGYQFDKMRVTPANDALVLSAANYQPPFVIDNYRGDCRISANGTTGVTVDTGAFFIYGRLVEILEPITVPVPSANGAYSICLKIDLSQANSASGDPLTADYTVTNNQISIVIVSGDAYQHHMNSNVIKQNLLTDGLVYMHPFGLITRSGSGLSVKPDSGHFFDLQPWLAPGFDPYDSDSHAWRFGIAVWDNVACMVGNLNGTKPIAKHGTATVLKAGNQLVGLGGVHSIQGLFLQCSSTKFGLWQPINSDDGDLNFLITRIRDGSEYTATSTNEWFATGGIQWPMVGNNFNLGGV